MALQTCTFLFDIKYRMGKSNKAADTLSHHPIVPGKDKSTCESEGNMTISNATVSNDLKDILDLEKILIECKRKYKKVVEKRPKRMIVHSRII